jgi:hypothetical protein
MSLAGAAEPDRAARPTAVLAAITNGTAQAAAIAKRRRLRRVSKKGFIASPSAIGRSLGTG